MQRRNHRDAKKRRAVVNVTLFVIISDVEQIARQSYTVNHSMKSVAQNP